MVTPGLDSIEHKLDEASNAGLERFKVAKQLEAEVEKLKAFDQQIDQKLHHTKTSLRSYEKR